MAHDPGSEMMRAMIFEGVARPLRATQLPLPRAGDGQVLLKVRACGVCRTDLHLLDGEVEVTELPRVLGHQIVGVVQAAPLGERATAPGGPAQAQLRTGQLVGVPWLGWTCGVCEYCTSGRENLCVSARFTGCDIDGGMAQYAVADTRYCFALREGHPDEQLAPLLCAGLIGYRALRMCGDAQTLGLYGFGAAAHILAQVAVWQGREVYAFTSPGDDAAQAFALELGCTWAGASDELPPRALHAAIIFAPVGALVPLALRAVARGGVVVCGGIHMSDIPSFPYSELWEERMLRSVANLTRRDGEELLELAQRAGVHTRVTTYPLERANEALADLRAGRFTGAAVLVP